MHRNLGRALELGATAEEAQEGDGPSTGGKKSGI